jgi:hypothetical protein
MNGKIKNMVSRTLKSLEFLLEIFKMVKNEDHVQQSESTMTPCVESSANQRNNITKNEGLIRSLRVSIKDPVICFYYPNRIFLLK